MSEVYVSFMYESIARFLTTPEFQPHLDQLFDSRRWRQASAIAESEQRKLLIYDLYETQLRHAGAEQVVKFELYEGGRLIYAIFFATHSTAGADRMKQAIWKVDPSGGFAFRGTRSPQLALDLQTVDYRPLMSALHAEFAGRGWVEFGQIEEFVSSDRTDYHKGHVRKTLAQMERAGQIEVDTSTRKRRATFPAGVRVRFIAASTPS